jgi:hypothetical protein
MMMMTCHNWIGWKVFLAPSLYFVHLYVVLCSHRVYAAVDVIVEVLCSVTSGLSPSKQSQTVGGPSQTVMHHPVSDNTPGR